jgi:hypothetical protein
MFSRGPRWMGKGGGGMDYEAQGGGGGRNIEGKEGWDGNEGAPCLALSGGTCSCRGAAALAIAITAAETATAMVTAMATATARVGSTDKELADHQRAAERDERDQEDAEEGGGQSSQDAWEFGTQGVRGGDNDAGI